MSNSNATAKTKKCNGAPNHKVLYDDLQCEIALLRKRHAALQTTFKNGLVDMDKLTRENAARRASEKSLHTEIHRQSNNNIQLMLDNEQLTTEACRSIENLAERNYYRRSARIWCICSGLLLVGILALAVCL